MEKMFINARNVEELRIAIVKDNLLNDVIIEHPGQEQKKGNIYKAVVTHREESLNAIFVKYIDDGSTRDGFLPKNEILPEYFTNGDTRNFEQLSVKDIPEGTEMIIQVDKEERGSKGAAITSYISLAGCYLVLMPNNPRAGGISRRIEGEDRNELREVLSQLVLPEHAGVIIRTAGVGKSVEELQWDLDVLIKLWDAISASSKTRRAPVLIHQESDAIGRAIRDYLRQGISEILVDQHDAWEKARYYVTQLKPDFVNQVRLYSDEIPLFNRNHIESQIEAAFLPQIKLPSGGNIVIDHTEALISVDVNSAKATRGGDIEETAFHTNLEAAKEISRQFRIRDLSGIIVIDFIDMSSISHQREVENTLREEVKQDRARIQIGRISRFGILEMSRQRMRPSLRESSSIICPRCKGHGRIRAIESLTLAILRLLREDAMNKKTVLIEAQLPIPIATFLLNEKRNEICDIEKLYQVQILLIPNEHLETPHYRLKSFSQEGVRDRTTQASYRLASREERDFENEPHSIAVIQTEPAIKAIDLNLPVPPKAKPNLLKRVWETIFGDHPETTTAETTPPRSERPVSSESHSRPAQHRHSRNDQRGRGGRSSGGERSGSQQHSRGERQPSRDNRSSGYQSNRNETSERPNRQRDENVGNEQEGYNSSAAPQGQRRNQNQRRNNNNRRGGQQQSRRPQHQAANESTTAPNFEPEVFNIEKPIASAAPAAPTMPSASYDVVKPMAKPLLSETFEQMPVYQAQPGSSPAPMVIPTTPAPAPMQERPAQERPVQEKSTESKPINNDRPSFQQTEIFGSTPAPVAQQPTEQEFSNRDESGQNRQRSGEAEGDADNRRRNRRYLRSHSYRRRHGQRQGGGEATPGTPDQSPPRETTDTGPRGDEGSTE